MPPHLDQTKPAHPLWISEHVEEQAFWLGGAEGPDRAMGGEPGGDVAGVDGESYEEGELGSGGHGRHEGGQVGKGRARKGYIKREGIWGE